MYAFGSSTPMAKTPTASMTLVISSVIVFTVSSELPPQDLGSKIFPQYGPMIIPKTKARGASPIYN